MNVEDHPERPPATGAMPGRLRLHQIHVPERQQAAPPRRELLPGAERARPLQRPGDQERLHRALEEVPSGCQHTDVRLGGLHEDLRGLPDAAQAQLAPDVRLPAADAAPDRMQHSAGYGLHRPADVHGVVAVPVRYAEQADGPELQAVRNRQADGLQAKRGQRVLARTHGHGGSAAIMGLCGRRGWRRRIRIRRFLGLLVPQQPHLLPVRDRTLRGGRPGFRGRRWAIS